MGQLITQVDAFTDKPFYGNPAAVCILPSTVNDDWMLLVAREMNLAETAFLVKQEDGSYNLRWFTPTVEVDLCGHATLASAHVLWEEGQLEPDEVARFHTRSGLLTARLEGHLIELDFPAEVAQPLEPAAGLLEALGLSETPLFVGKNRMDILVEVADEQTVKNLKPDMGQLKQVNTRGVIVTSRASSDRFDFVSRFFAPAAGIDEDPVTGSAHCCLGPYWAGKLGKTELAAYQASTRSGVLRVRVGDNGRVYLGGQAVTVLHGELLG